MKILSKYTKELFKKEFKKYDKIFSFSEEGIEEIFNYLNSLNKEMLIDIESLTYEFEEITKDKPYYNSIFKKNIIKNLDNKNILVLKSDYLNKYK